MNVRAALFNWKFVVWFAVLALFTSGGFVAGGLCFREFVGVVPVKSPWRKNPEKVWADKAARLVPGTYWMGSGSSKMTLTLRCDKASGGVENIVVIGVDPLFSLSYFRSKAFGAPVIAMHSGGFSHHGRTWEDVGVKGRLLVRRVGPQSLARWRGKWLKIMKKASGDRSVVEFGGQLHRYDPSSGGWRTIVPTRDLHSGATSRPTEPTLK